MSLNRQDREAVNIELADWVEGRKRAQVLTATISYLSDLGQVSFTFLTALGMGASAYIYKFLFPALLNSVSKRSSVN